MTSAQAPDFGRTAAASPIAVARNAGQAAAAITSAPTTTPVVRVARARPWLDTGPCDIRAISPPVDTIVSVDRVG